MMRPVARALALAALVLAVAACARSESTQEASDAVEATQAQLDRDRDAAGARRDAAVEAARIRRLQPAEPADANGAAASD